MALVAGRLRHIDILSIYQRWWYKNEKTRDATPNETIEHISRTNSTIDMIQTEAAYALKIQKKRKREGENEKRAAHVGMVPSSELPPEGG